jgi:hypothetical protein
LSRCVFGGHFVEHFREFLAATCGHIQKANREARGFTAACGHSHEAKDYAPELKLDFHPHENSGRVFVFGDYPAATQAEIRESAPDLHRSGDRKNHRRTIDGMARKDPALATTSLLYRPIFADFHSSPCSLFD